MIQRPDIAPPKRAHGRASIQLAGLVAAAGLAMLHGTARADADLQTVIDGVANVTTETFSSTSGDVLDGCISTGTHRVLRFNFRSRNIDDGTMTVGPPPPAPP